MSVDLKLNMFYVIFGIFNDRDESLIHVLNFCILFGQYFIANCKKSGKLCCHLSKGIKNKNKNRNWKLHILSKWQRSPFYPDLEWDLWLFVNVIDIHIISYIFCYNFNTSDSTSWFVDLYVHVKQNLCLYTDVY